MLCWLLGGFLVVPVRPLISDAPPPGVREYKGPVLSVLGQAFSLHLISVHYIHYLIHKT